MTVPFGISFDSRKKYRYCQLKSYCGTLSMISDLPSGYKASNRKLLPRRCMCGHSPKSSVSFRKICLVVTS